MKYITLYGKYRTASAISISSKYIIYTCIFILTLITSGMHIKLIIGY